MVHARQKHSIDIVMAEVLCCLNWYNPFAWLMKKAIRQNLEFIADNQSILNGADRKDYQYLLLRSTGSGQFELANQFAFSSLKNRIKMMNADRSKKLLVTLYCLILPLVAILLMAFRSSVDFKIVSTQLSVDGVNYPKVRPRTYPKLEHVESINKRKAVQPKPHENQNSKTDDKETLQVIVRDTLAEANTITTGSELPLKLNPDNADRSLPPPGFIAISAKSTEQEIKDFIALLIENKYEVDISKSVFDGPNLQEFSGVLTGEPFKHSLTGPMSFQITATNASVLGVSPANGALYWYHIEGRSDNK
jgi:hypothetical protein